MKEFDENNVIDKERLHENFGMSNYLGVGAQQNHKAYKVFYEFLKKNKPKRILEIGTGVGGFAHALQTFITDLELDTYLLTYDIAPVSQEMLKEIGIDARLENVFDEKYTEVSQYIVDFIRQDGTTIVLCDGGWKVGEFRILSEFLKPGDFILAHDYSSSYEFFLENINEKIWNWCEIKDIDIEDVSVKYNLAPYEPEAFQEAVWVCKIKEK